MSAEDDVKDLMDQARSLPWGKTSSAIMAQAAALAEAEGLEELAAQAHVNLVAYYGQGGEETKRLAPFIWCMGRLQERPDLFDDDMRSALGWSFKGVVATASHLPEVPVAKVWELLEEMRLFHLQRGDSLEAYYLRKWRLHSLFGEEEAAAQAYAQARSLGRGEFSDCSGCDPEWDVTYYCEKGQWEDAVRVGDKALADTENHCGAQPEALLSALLEAYLRTGRDQEAWAGHVRAYRRYQTDQTEQSYLRSHLRYLTISGQAGRPARLERAKRIFLRHLPWWSGIENPYDLFLLAATCVALVKALPGDPSSQTLPATLPGSTLPWFKREDLVEPTYEQARGWLDDLAREISEAFDQRAGFPPGMGPTHAKMLQLTDPEPIDPLPAEVVADVSGMTTLDTLEYPVITRKIRAQRENTAPAEEAEEEPLVTFELDGHWRELSLEQLLEKTQHHRLIDTVYDKAVLDLLVADPSLADSLEVLPLHLRESFLHLREKARDFFPQGRFSFVDLHRDLNNLPPAGRLRSPLQYKALELAAAFEQVKERPGMEGEEEAQADVKASQAQLTKRLSRLADIAQADLERDLAPEGEFDASALSEQTLREVFYPALRHLYSIAFFLNRWGDGGRCRELAEDLFARFQPEQWPADLRAEALVAVAEILKLGGMHQDACILADQAMRTPSDEPLSIQLEALDILAYASGEAGFIDESVNFGRGLVNLSAAAGLSAFSTIAAESLADRLSQSERHLEAAEVAESAIMRNSLVASSHRICGLRISLADALAALGQDSQAADQYLAVADIYALRGDDPRAARSLYHNAATGYSNSHQADKAAPVWAQLAKEYGEAENYQKQADYLFKYTRELATVPSRTQRRDNLPIIEKTMDELRQLYRDHTAEFGRSVEWLEADWHHDMARLYWEVDADRLALDYLEIASASFKSQDKILECGVTMVYKAQILASFGDFDEAEATLDEVEAMVGPKRASFGNLLQGVQSLRERIRNDRAERGSEED